MFGKQAEKLKKYLCQFILTSHRTQNPDKPLNPGKKQLLCSPRLHFQRTKRNITFSNILFLLLSGQVILLWKS